MLRRTGLPTERTVDTNELILGAPHIVDERLAGAVPDPLGPGNVVRPWTDGAYVDAATVSFPDVDLGVGLVADVAPARTDVLRRWTVIGAVVATLLAVVTAATYPLSRQAELGEHVRDVALHGGRSDVEGLGDLGVAGAPAQLGEDLLLSVGELARFGGPSRAVIRLGFVAAWEDRIR